MKWCDLIDSNDIESQALNFIRTSHVFCWSIHIFLRRNATCTISRRPLDGDNDMICFRTSFMHISKRAPCLKDLIWRYYWTMSPWAIGFDNNEKSLFEHRMNSNRLKTTYSRFYRVACCLIEESRILFDMKMTRFFLSWNFS